MDKKYFYSNTIQNNVGNIKQTWKIVNETVNKTSKTTKIDSINAHDKVITYKKVFPNIMNIYLLTTAILNIASTIISNRFISRNNCRRCCLCLFSH